MPNNKGITDIKPENNQATDIKPINNDVIDIKPNNFTMSGVTQFYTDTRTVEAGQVMGLLLALTYPVAGTFTNALRL